MYPLVNLATNNTASANIAGVLVKLWVSLIAKRLKKNADISIAAAKSQLFKLRKFFLFIFIIVPFFL